MEDLILWLRGLHPAWQYVATVWLTLCVAVIFVAIATLIPGRDRKPVQHGYFGPLTDPGASARTPKR